MLVKIITDDGDGWVNPDDVQCVFVKAGYQNYKDKKLGRNLIFRLSVHIRNLGAKSCTFKTLADAHSEMERIVFQINAAHQPKNSN